MKQLQLISILIVIAIDLFMVSCKHDAELVPGSMGDTGGTGGNNTPCDSTKVYFQQQVLPVLLSNCAMSGCHDDASHQDGVVLTSYAKVMSTADIRPGRPGDSELYERITDNDPSERMPRPPRSPLTAAQISLIRRWIEQGAKDITCQSLCDSNSFTYSGAIKSIIGNKCQGCHSGAAASGGIDLSSYAGVKTKITDGRLWGAINHQSGFSAMPKNGAKLSDCEIAQVRKWIEVGSPNN
jgi:mono/diheme cytochrome c family protein